MSERDPIEELMEFGLNGVDGPSSIAPPKPEPYLTCRGCKYHKKSMVHSGGLRGAPKYNRDCIHPDVEGLNGQHYRSLTTGFRGSSSGSMVVTPNWCPVLKKNDPVDISDSVLDNSQE